MRGNFLTGTSGCLGLVGLILASAGCQNRLPTTTEETLDYVRNAVVGAEVRRLDPEPQAYMDAVFKVYMEWKNAQAPMESLTSLKGFWKKDSRLWCDQDAVEKCLQQIEAWQADRADPETKDAKTRAELLRELSETIEQVPEMARSEADDFTASIRATMDCQARERWLQLMAADLRALFAFVAEHSADLKPQATGLQFESPSHTARAEALWRTAWDRIVARGEATVERYQRIHRPERTKALARKKQLYTKGLANETDRRIFRRLEVLIAYYERLRIESETIARELDRYRGQVQDESGLSGGCRRKDGPYRDVDLVRHDSQGTGGKWRFRPDSQAVRLDHLIGLLGRL